MWVPPQSILEKPISSDSLTSTSQVDAFTPSALSAVLLSAPRDESYDYATLYAALRRHLSASHTERHYYEDHGYATGENYRDVRHPSFMSRVIIRMRVLITVKISAFTVPYFSLTDKPPASDQVSLSPSGIFGDGAIGKRYIREQKFSVSWSGGTRHGEPSLMIALNPLSQYWDDDPRLGGDQPSTAGWVRNNLFVMGVRWREVLDALDEQTTLPVRRFFCDRPSTNPSTPVYCILT